MEDIPIQIKKIKDAVIQLERDLLTFNTSSAAVPSEAMINVAFMAVRLYAESHPRPSQVSQKQAAEMLGLSHVTVSKLLKSGVIKLNKTGQIPIAEIDRALTVT